MKKLSRVLLVLCLLTALVCTVSVTAFAAQTDATVVERIDIYCPEPMLEENPHDYADRITCAEQDGYTIQITGVSTNNGSWGTGFTYGASFSYQIRINANEGYTFDDTPIYVNDAPVNKTATGSTTLYLHSALLGEPLEQVDIPAWPTDLQPGQAAGEGELPLPEGSKFTVSYKWTAYRSSYLYSTPIAVLEDGKLYALHYIVKPVSGYYFSDDTLFTIGGEAVDCNARLFEATFQKELAVNVTYIDTFDISYTPPRAGDSCADFTIDADDTVKITFFEVRATGTQTTFEEGSPYTLYVNTSVNTGYALADTVTVTFNGQSPQTFDTSSHRTSLGGLLHTIVMAQPITEVAFPAWPENVVPGPGGMADLTAPEGAGYILKQVWADPYTSETVVAEQLEAGKMYMLLYYAEALPGFVFSEDAVATVDGVAYPVLQDSKTLAAYQIYDLGTVKIDRIQLTLPTLYKGCTPKAVTAPANANYTLVINGWTESKTRLFKDAQDIDVPSYQTTVYAHAMLLANSGYSFAEEVTLIFNGKEVVIEDFSAEGPLLEIAGAYCTLKKPTGTGWYQEDDTWAYYEKGVKAVSRWIRDSIDWCYVGADGLMVKNGFARDSKGWCYLGADGYMVYNRWVLHNGDWYFMNQNGYRLQNTWKRDSVDWCYLGADGKMLKNAWQRDSKGWCYVGGDGYMVRNQWAADSHGICRLNGSGYMVYNTWILDPDGWRYVDTNGYMVYNGWALWKGYWYAFDAYGVMFSDTLVEYKGKYYRLEADGRMLTSSWFMVGNYWTYVNADGYIPLKTWVRDSKGWCYIGANGYMLTDSWVTTDGKRYYVGSDGRRLCNTTRTFYEGYLKTTYTFDHNGVAKQQGYF